MFGLRVADVNFDMVVDIDDAWDVLAYYSEHIVSGQPYNGEIGKYRHILHISFSFPETEIITKAGRCLCGVCLLFSVNLPVFSL